LVEGQAGRVRKGLGKMANGVNGVSVKPWDMFLRIVGMLVIPWAIWVSITLIEVSQDVAVIKGNRFTASDANVLYQELAKRPVREEVPPAWFIKEVEEIKDSLARHVENHE